MDIFSTAIGGLLVAAVVSPASWFLSKWSTQRASEKRSVARRAESQWTLEQLNGTEWTLRRDSESVAFGLHVWEEGDWKSAGEVVISEFVERGDMHPGRIVRLAGVRPGAEVSMDWVENAERRMAVVVAREGVRKIVVKRSDTTLRF